MPTILLLPIMHTFLFNKESVHERISSQQANGVQVTKQGVLCFIASVPILYGLIPSTSFSDGMQLITFCSLICLGNGNCTMIPEILGSLDILIILSMISYSVTVSSNSTPLWSIPISSHALVFNFTQREDSDLEPTKI